MMLRWLAMAALVTVVQPAAAAPFHKCTSNGAVTYQNTPCTTDEKQRQPTPDELNAERRKKQALEKAGGVGDSARSVPGPSAPAALADAPKPPAPTKDAGSVGTKVAAPSASAFRCDGRTHCSQMTSCAEATYFLKNCPGVKMDGNHDGVPCEQQWCRR
jgi:hypothetical protein